MQSLKTRNMLMFFAILGAVITIGTAYVQWNEKRKAEELAEANKKEADEKQKELENANKAIMSLQTQTINSVNTISELQDKLIHENGIVKELQNKLLQSSEKTISNITGGSTFPYIMVNFASTPRGFVVFNLASKGENPLYELSLNIIDNDKYKFKDENEYKKMLEAESNGNYEGRKSFNVGNFRPREIREILSFMMQGDETERNFSVELIARNGFFKQQIKIIKEGDKLRVEYQVRKGDQILKKHP